MIFRGCPAVERCRSQLGHSPSTSATRQASVGDEHSFHAPAMYLLESGLRRAVPEEFRVRREMTSCWGPATLRSPMSWWCAEAERGLRQTRYEAADVPLAVEVRPAGLRGPGP